MSEAAEQTPDPSSDVLRVMSNPFRARAYDALLIFGDMTTRKLAQLTSISEASLNEHMRQLRGIGFVRPVNADAPVRQLVWHGIPGGVRLGNLAETEEYTAEAKAWLAATLEAETQVLQGWLEISQSWPVEWRNAVERWDYVMKALTVEQLSELSQQLNELANRWMQISRRQEHMDLPEARTVFLVTHAVPWPVDYEEDGV